MKIIIILFTLVSLFILNCMPPEVGLEKFPRPEEPALKIYTRSPNSILMGKLSARSDQAFYILDSTSKTIRIPISTVHSIGLDSFYLQIPDSSSLTFYALHSDSIQIPLYEVVYDIRHPHEALQIVKIDSALIKIHLADTVWGYIPLYIKIEDLKQIFNWHQGEFTGFIHRLLQNGKIQAPLQLTAKAINSEEWKWLTRSYTCPRRWSNAPVTSLMTEPQIKSKKLTKINQGTELVIIDSTKEWYRVIISHPRFLIGWVPAAQTSLEPITQWNDGDVEEYLHLLRIKEYIQSYGVKPKIAEKMLSKGIIEGMTREMVLLSWGEPQSKENRDKRYLYPELWTYRQYGYKYMLNFDGNGVLKSFGKEKIKD